MIIARQATSVVSTAAGTDQARRSIRHALQAEIFLEDAAIGSL
jgi:hypothetical protein